MLGQRVVELRFVRRKKRAVRGGERTCRESLVKRPCVKEKDTELLREITAFGQAEGSFFGAVCVRSELLCGREGAFVWERRLSVGEKLLSREFDEQFRERLVLWMVFVAVWSPVHSSSCERWRRSRRFRRRVHVCEGDTCRQDTSQPTEPQGSSFFFFIWVFGVCVCVRPRPIK